MRNSKLEQLKNGKLTYKVKHLDGNIPIRGLPTELDQWVKEFGSEMVLGWALAKFLIELGQDARKATSLAEAEACVEPFILACKGVKVVRQADIKAAVPAMTAEQLKALESQIQQQLHELSTNTVLKGAKTTKK